MKRVLHISSGGLTPGGVGSVIFSIVESLHEEVSFDCVVFNRIGQREEEFKAYGELHRIHCYPKKGKRDYLELLLRPLKLYFGMRRICKSRQYDVIHCHNQHDAWPCLLAAKHAGVPVRISHAHVGIDGRKRSPIEAKLKKNAIRLLNKYATLRVACSAEAGRLLFGDNEFVLIPNCVDLSKYTRKGDVPEDMAFVHVGRYTYSKNQEFVLESFAEICKDFPEAHLYLIGYGEAFEVDRLKGIIEKLGIEDRVEMVPGDVADIPSYYERSRYMIFPSRFEGFGIVLIEAQAMNIECYASEVIPKEADVGLLHFMDLSDGPRAWAERIVADIKNGTGLTLDEERLSQYSNETISKRYAAIYNGESESV